MTELMARRRALMGKLWSEIPFDKTSFVFSSGFGSVSYNAQTDTINCVMSKAGTYKAADAPFSTSEGYEYKICCEYEASAGVARLSMRNNNFQEVKKTASANAPASGSFTLIFSHDSSISKLTLFCSFATSVKGNVSYASLKIYRRPI